MNALIFLDLLSALGSCLLAAQWSPVQEHGMAELVSQSTGLRCHQLARRLP